MQAVRKGQVDKVKAFLTEDPGLVSQLSDDGWLPLNEAVYWDRNDVIPVLVEAGADVNANSAPSTALYMALRESNEEVFETLLMVGANTELEVLGFKIIHHAADLGKTPQLRLLAKYGADLDSLSSDRFTPLRYAIDKGHSSSVYALLENGADPNRHVSSSGIPILAAVALEDPAIISALARHGADIEYKIPDAKMTPLVYSVSTCKPKSTEALLDAGAKADAQPAPGIFPTHVAVATDCPQSFDLLIEHGAKLNTSSLAGKSLMHSATNGSTVRKLAKLGVPIDLETGTGATPLLIAALKGNQDVVATLIKFGANVDHTDQTGAGPLHYATANGHIDVVKLLIRKEASLNAVSARGSTPLMLAAAKGDYEAAKLLLKMGAKTDIVNDSGKTAHDLAITGGYEKVASLLAKYS